VELFSRAVKTRWWIVTIAALFAEAPSQIFQSSPRIQEERLRFIDEIGRSGFTRAAYITECRGLPSVGLCRTARPAGLDEERGVGERF
jgi:hypothetical protein